MDNQRNRTYALVFFQTLQLILFLLLLLGCSIVKCISLYGKHLLQYPVYFAFESDDINAVLADIKKNDAIGQPATATTGGLVLLTYHLKMRVSGKLVLV